MNVRTEINKYAKDSDKPSLRWLFDRYSMASQWAFVAFCTHKRYGTRSYETNRVWRPTEEGRMLYAASALHDALENLCGQTVKAYHWDQARKLLLRLHEEQATC